jgi:hypothetical protein
LADLLDRRLVDVKESGVDKFVTDKFNPPSFDLFGVEIDDPGVLVAKTRVALGGGLLKPDGPCFSIDLDSLGFGSCHGLQGSTVMKSVQLLCGYWTGDDMTRENHSAAIPN